MTSTLKTFRDCALTIAILLGAAVALMAVIPGLYYYFLFGVELVKPFLSFAMGLGAWEGLLVSCSVLGAISYGGLLLSEFFLKQGILGLFAFLLNIALLAPFAAASFVLLASCVIWASVDVLASIAPIFN